MFSERRDSGVKQVIRVNMVWAELELDGLKRLDGSGDWDPPGYQ